MFAKETNNSIMFFDDGKKVPDVPSTVKIPDLAVPPLTMVAPADHSAQPIKIGNV